MHLVCNLSALVFGDSEDTWVDSFRVDMTHIVNVVVAAIPHL